VRHPVECRNANLKDSRRVFSRADEYARRYLFAGTVIWLTWTRQRNAAHGVRSMRMLGGAGASARAQQSNTDQQMSFRNRWSSITSSRIASGSWSRCHRHSSRPALSPAPSGAAARAALIA